MKCATHVDQDALGVCHICGSGACQQCSQRIGGIVYCLTCLDAGRYRPPLVKQPSRMETQQVPTGYLTRITRLVFIVGIIAMVLMIIGHYLVFFSPALAPIYYLTSPYRTWALVFIAIGISLTGITFFGFYRYYDSFVALSVSLFSLLSGWPMVLSDLLLYNPTVISPGSYPFDYSPGPLYPLYHFSSLIGTLLLAITFIAWTIVFLRTRPFIPAPTLTVVASLFWVIIGHFYIFQMILVLISGGNPFLLLSYYFSQFSMFMIIAAEPAAILSAIVFYRIRK